MRRKKNPKEKVVRRRSKVSCGSKNTEKEVEERVETNMQTPCGRRHVAKKSNKWRAKALVQCLRGHQPVRVQCIDPAIVG